MEALRSEGLFFIPIFTVHMKIQIWTIGKAHDSYVKEGIELFTKRISNYFPVSWKIITPPKNAGALPAAALKSKEGEQVAEMLQKDDLLILLDEGGRQMKSE